MTIGKTPDTTSEESTAAPADTNPAAASVATPLRNRKGLALAGVIGGGVLVAGLLLGGGVAIGSALDGGHGGRGGDDRRSAEHPQDEQRMGARSGDGQGGERPGDGDQGAGDNDAQGRPGRPPAGQPNQGPPPVEGGAPAAPGQPAPATPAAPDVNS